MGLFETIRMARALRHLKPDPVPDDVYRQGNGCGGARPNGSHLQNWRFVVIKDAARRRQVADLYRASMQLPVSDVTFMETFGNNWPKK